MEEDKFMAPSYFQLIYDQLSIIEKLSRDDYQMRRLSIPVDKRFTEYYQVLSQVLPLKSDVGFLKTFSFCLETWNYTTDEETMERLRSVIAPLKVIWPEEHQGLSLLKRLTEMRSIEIDVFHSVYFELEAKIQHSKVLIEGWCENLMQFKFPVVSYSYSRIWYILHYLQKNLNDLSWHKAENNVQLKKQIGILKAKIVFLETSLNFCKSCPYGLDNRAGQQFLNFIGDFTSSASCLTCLYWVKEANEEEIATGMSLVLFHMLQRFIPSPPDITTLYIGILKSYDFQPSDSFHLEKAVESFVDFFFGQLATTLMDAFVILRERLIFLFIFLTDPPRENVDEEDLINSQIFALFRDDAYLFLPFVEMKEDFSDKKILLTEFVIKIDVKIAKIRQLYSGFSDSRIRSEVEKMEDVYFVSTQKEFASIEEHAKLKFFWYTSAWHQLQLYRKELRFLRVFLLCVGSWDDIDDEIKVRLSSTVTSLQRIWGEEEIEEKGLLAPRFHAIRTREIIDWDPLQLESLGDISTGDITNWDPLDLEIEYEVSTRQMADWHQLALELQGKIQLSKLEIEAWWVDLFHSSFQCKPSTSYKIIKFLDSILENLNDLVNYKAKQIVPFKKQIETLKDKLVFLKNFMRLAANRICGKELVEFKMFVQVFANDAACLTFLYWAKDATDKIASETNSMLSHTLQKIKPTTPDVAKLYFKTLKAIYVQRSDSIVFGKAALSFVDLFFEDLVTPLKDDFQILRDEIVFLLTFLNDPPNENAAESICSRIDVSFWEGAYGLLPLDDMEGDFSPKKALLSDFMMTIDTVNANIRHIYCKFPDSSGYNFPKVVSPRFLDFLLQNLKNLKEIMISDHRKYAPFAKYKIIKIEEELVSLCPFFNHIFDLQRELNETWLEVVNLLYLIEHVINLCISSCFVFDHPIWYHMAYISDVLDETKVVKTKLEKIKENTMYDARSIPHSGGFISTPSEQASNSEINEIVVGFENEVEKIIGMLTQGHMSLDIVSIVGMGGLGKTTLAKKVYGSSLVKCSFVVFAFCSVSQDHNTRKLLLDILCDINGVDDKINDMTDEDLAHQVWKCLSRRKYLIVLDDIWYTSSWNKVKSSFPDDKNGSRVMITTRSHEVADSCKINCSPYQLRFLSEVESWELLQKKVFRSDISPPYLYEIGRLIAKNCKGLPLAVVVIAGLLARTEKSLRWWSDVAERVVSYLSDEGCKQILELSYKHLPKDLKPCFVYLGAFPEDSLIRVKHVILLWIAEGFIQESRTKNIEDVAKRYFHDLVDRSLIIVSARSSTGEVKTFRVHDLIHDLCQTKCREGNFFQLNHEIASSRSSDPSINKHYRVSTHKQSDVIISADSSVSSARCLLYFREQRAGLTNDFTLRESRLAQVLDLNHLLLHKYDTQQLTSEVHLRHIHARLMITGSVPSSISNLWNIGSLMLTSVHGLSIIQLPKTFWKMKSLRYVKVDKCVLAFSDRHEHEAYHKLDKVVSFSKPILSRVKDVQRLLQRLPAVRELSCILRIDHYDEETLDFHNKLESLKLSQTAERIPFLINFPSTLKKLTLEKFQLPWTAISAIAELKCLEVLRLQRISFPGPRFEMEDVAFRNLKFFELDTLELVEWSASTESLPCLEQLVIRCTRMEELPPCFGEISTLKRIVVKASPRVESSALRIRDEQMELGNDVEVSIYN